MPSESNKTSLLSFPAGNVLSDLQSWSSLLAAGISGGFLSEAIERIGNPSDDADTVLPAIETAAGTNSTADTTITVFGPKRFTRTTGAPNNYVDTFAMPQNCTNGVYRLIILNGESDGSNRISSAVVKLNGLQMFSQSDFNQNVYRLEKQVTLSSQNTLEIRLTSPPNSYLTVEVRGENCGSSDTTPPGISITAPADNTATINANTAISGTAEDAGVNASGIAQVLVNNTAVPYNPATKTWQLASAALSPGANQFIARAIDNAGNATTTQVTVIRDLTNPSITITSPANNTVTLAENVSVSGTAVDAGSDASGIRTVKVNGVNANLDLPTGNWNLPFLSLNIGDNTLTAVATDQAGNQASTQIVVRRAVNQPPAVNAGPDRNAMALSSNNKHGIYAMNADGSNQTRLTFTDAEEQAGNWSPDHTKIVFSSNRDGNREIYTMNADGSNQVRLTVNPAQDSDPTFSPDGTKIVFASYRTGNGDIYSMNADGSGLTQLTNNSDIEYHARWQPAGVGINGNRIAFFRYSSNDVSSGEVWSMAADGSGQTNLTNTFGVDDGPVWSPDGTKIAFVSRRDGNIESYVMNADGTAQTRLTNNPADDYVNDWSNDGQYLTCISNRAGSFEIYKLRFTDSALTRLTFNTASDYRAYWSPNGNKIVFSSNRQGVYLQGTITDDGLPAGNSLTASWSKISGPGSVSFDSPTSAVTNADFSAAGTYVLRLTADDGQLSASDEVTVEVSSPPANQAPVVNAGPDQAIRSDQTATLNGQIGDDGLPLHVYVTSTWSKVSGPGNVTFATPYASATTAQFTAPGTYVLQLTAFDSQLTTSDQVTVVVSAVNQAPAVNAGADQTIALPSAADLNGSVTDDGLPNASLNISWSKVSGTGTVSFANANSPNTTATFSQAGTYALRLTASDEQLTTSDEVTITVVPANQPPTVSAGPDRIINLPTNSPVTLSGTVSDDGVPQNGSLSYVWSKTSGPGEVIFSDSGTLTPTVCFGASGIYVLRLTATDGELSGSDELTIIVRTLQTQILRSGNGEFGQPDSLNLVSRDAGQTYNPAYVVEKYPSWGIIPGTQWNNFVPSPWVAGIGNWSADGSTVKYRTSFTLPADYSEASLAGLIEVDNRAIIYLNGVEIGRHNGFADPPGEFSTTNASLFRSGENTIDITAIDDGGGVAGLNYKISVYSVGSGAHPNQSPIVLAGVDRAAYVNRALLLNGNVRDDYLPSCGGSPISSWSKISGPGEAYFTNPSSVSTNVSFSSQGTYVLRLSAADGELSGFDDVTVTVYPQNQPPTANAGSDRTVTLPNSASLNGTVTDDGLPSNSLTIAWSKVSGPGNVTFTNSASAATTASFSTAGVYVLRLTASDGQLSASDDVRVNAEFAPNAEPQPFNYRSFDDSPWRNFEGPAFYLEDFEDHLLNTPGVTATTGGLVSILYGPAAHDSVDADDGVLDGNGLNGDNFFNLDGTQGIKFVFSQQPGIGYPTHVGVVYTDGAGETYYEPFGANGASLGVKGPFTFPVTSHYGEAINDFFLGIYSSGGISAIRVWSVNGGGVEVDHLQYGYQPNTVSNTPPTVTAGNPQTITLPTNTVSLQGAVSDDGLPASGSLQVAWTKVSGSGSVSFTNQNQLNTAAAFGQAGVYVLRLTATDGELSGSSEVTVTVNPQSGGTPTPTPTGNQPPTVNAGNDQTVALNNVLTLNGAATDDGLPNNSLTAQWSKISGAGNVAFSNPANPQATVNFSAEGIYVLRLTATDGQLSSSDDLTVTVTPAQINQPPTANAGADKNITIKGNLLQNGSAEAGLINGELPNWTEVQGSTWTKLEGGISGVPFARFGASVFSAGDAANAELRQDVDVRAYSETINNGTQAFEWKAYLRSAAETVPDSGRIIFEYRDFNQNLIAALDSGEIATTSGWHLTEDARVPPQGTGFIRIRLIAAKRTGATNDAFFDGMSLKAVGNIAAVKLNGARSDDGLPSGSTLASTWTKVSGPGSVVFGNAGAVDSSVSFTAAGTYVLRLTATDGTLSASDEMTVTVNAANAAPTVNAGADRTVNSGSPVQLNGTATDDGNPIGGAVFVRWEKTSGPGAVSINNPRLLNPTISFTTAGTYVLRLTAEDGDLEASDDIAITVNQGSTNQPPAVEAGNNQTITLPTNSVNLSGTATDDGLPNNNLTIAWSKTSGAGSVTFAHPNVAQTTATFSAAGSYVLRLTAGDGQYTVYDEVAITVNAAGAQNQPPTVNVGADRTVTLAQGATFQPQVSDDGLPQGATYSAQWSKVSGSGTVTFSHPTELATFADFSVAGTYVLRLTVSDSQLAGSDDVTVTVVENQPAPAVEILTPADGIGITEPTTITGTVSGGSWKLDYSLTDTDNLANRTWTTLATGTGAETGNLGSLDTTLMLNGLYDVRLASTDQYGQTATDITTVAVENNLKVGHFTVSFEDMNVQVAGIPMQIVRTYDSRDKRKGDFGMGWTLGIKNVRVEKNGVLGLKWRQTSNGAAFPTYCVEATRPHVVTVTMPDGSVEKFEAKLQQMCQQFAPLTNGYVTFAAQGGTRGKLEIVGDNYVQIAGSVPGPVEFIAFDGTGIFDRATFKYTAKDGTQFVVNQGGGLQSVRDLDNNTLTISQSGIVHSSGKSIAFTRDAQGRITAVTDPNGKSNGYTYDAAGDLVSYKDRANNTTTFAYEAIIPHHLKSIVDPLGRTPIRNEYDASGRLLKHTDANGEEINYIHNLAARVETVTDRLGNATTFNYDQRGNVLQKTDALGKTTTFTYDGSDNVLTETNALGKTTTYTYDGQDNRTSVKDALGNRTEMTYNALGQVLTVKDARNNVTTNTFDSNGRLLKTKDAQNNETTHTYSVQTGQRTSTTDALNHVTRFEYVGNYLTKETDAQNNETTFTYDANGNRKSQTVKRTNAQGQVETITTTFEFDDLNRLVKTIQPDGAFTETEYNALGQQAAAIDQGGNRTEFDYDTLGRLVKTTYADGKFEESTFDAEGRRLTSKDRAGRITSYEYDALGRLKKTTYADGTFTQTSYDAAGQVLTSTDARNNVTTYTYDDAGRRLTVKNALNQVTSFAYDANGNQSSMTDALNRTTAYIYDALNRKTKTTFADASFAETTYDVLGRRILEKDQAGKVTQFIYDSLGRLTKVKDALNQETVYGYNEIGQQTSQKDALNREIKYEYDKLGRRTKRTLPMGQVETYSYSAVGNLESRTDFNGKTTTFGYDAMRRLLSKTPDASLNQPTVSFTYNDAGQRATMSDASGTTTYGYDTRNRLASKQTPHGTLTYTYDDAGGIKTVRSSNAGGVSVDYAYDELNRLKTAKDNRLSGSQTTTYTYDAVGNLQSYAYPNQVTTSYAYNNLNRLTTMTISNATNGLASYTYTLGAAGNRTKVVEGNGRTVNYVYDDLYRLTSETISNSANSGAVIYGYDAVGNRLSRNSSVNQVANQNSTFDANDRIGGDTFDDNGNTKISNGKTYSYDFENKLTSTSDGIQIIYDGDGNRVSKTVGGVTTKYLVDTNNLTGYAQVVEEIRNNQVVKAYTYGLDLISQRQSSGVSFYNYDGHGSVRGLSNSIGLLTDTYDYDAFGNLINRAGTTDNDYLYSGQQHDPNLGFYYNRARYLNTDAGRFISQDSYEGDNYDSMSLHKYLYTKNNPVNFSDPTGFYTQAFGYAVEEQVRPIYERDNFGDEITYGRWARIDGGYRLKPDVLNKTKSRFVEIKPFSLSGISAGVVQVAIYQAAFGWEGYTPHYDWMPSTNVITVQGKPTAIVNIGGLLLYTDEQRLFQEFFALTTVAAARQLLVLRAAGEFGRIAQLARLASIASRIDLAGRANLAVATTRGWF